MKQLSLLIITLFCLTACNETAQSRVFSLNDYTPIVTPDGTNDYTVALTSMIADALEANRKGVPVEIDLGSEDIHIYPETLAKHTLYISNHDHVAERPVGLMLEGFNGLTIKGNGAKLLMHGRVIPIVIKESEKVTLSGFFIDYPRPALSQIEVVEIKDNQVKVKVLNETQYRINDDKHFILLGEGYEQHLYVTMPFSSDKRMKWNRADVSFDPQKITDLGEHTLLIEGWQEQKYLAIGDRYVLRSYYRPTPGIVIIDSNKTRVESVTVHYAEGMALVAQHSTDITLDAFNVALAKGNERYFTSQADATHFSGCRGHLEVVNGLYENMADDAINVHGTYFRVDSILSETEIKASFAHGQSFGFTWLERGDSLLLINRQTLLPIQGSIGKDIKYLTPSEVIITLQEPLDLSTLAIGDRIAVENRSGHPTVHFAGNVVRHNRARGALFSTPYEVICENNFFDHTHGSAILLCGDANGWYESGPCYRVIIRQNHFLNALTARYQFTDGVISISPEIPETVNGAYYHGKVIVQNNRFENFPTPLFYAKSVQQFIFKENSVIQNEDFKSLFDSPHSVAVNVGELILDNDGSAPMVKQH